MNVAKAICYGHVLSKFLNCLCSCWKRKKSLKRNISFILMFGGRCTITVTNVADKLNIMADIKAEYLACPIRQVVSRFGDKWSMWLIALALRIPHISAVSSSSNMAYRLSLTPSLLPNPHQSNNLEMSGIAFYW
jgi:hypothetical protein